MKTLLVSALFLFTAHAHAGESLVCALKDASNPSNYSSVKVDLENIEADGYNDDKGIDIGKHDNYNFNLLVTRKGSKIVVSATFMENKHVQDEVSSSAWNVNLKKAKPGKPVISEPLENEGKKIMDFVCYYNQ